MIAQTLSKNSEETAGLVDVHVHLGSGVNHASIKTVKTHYALLILILWILLIVFIAVAMGSVLKEFASVTLLTQATTVQFTGVPTTAQILNQLQSAHAYYSTPNQYVSVTSGKEEVATTAPLSFV